MIILPVSVSLKAIPAIVLRIRLQVKILCLLKQSVGPENEQELLVNALLPNLVSGAKEKSSNCYFLVGSSKSVSLLIRCH